MKKILAIGLSTTIQETISFRHLHTGEVNRSEGYRLDASGKAVNAARVLHQLEAGSALAISPLGEENRGLFLGLLERDGLPLEGVSVPGRIRYCYTLLDEGSRSATELVVSEPVAAREECARAALEIEAILRRELPKAGALLIAGSRPASFPENAYSRFVTLAREAGVPVMVDYHGADLERTLEMTVPDIIKINEEEFCETFCPKADFGGDEEALAQAVASKSGDLGAMLVITRGHRDTLAAAGGQSFRQEVTPLHAINPIGCGDSFSAGFLYAFTRGGDLGAALRKGTWCAARNALSIRPGDILEG